MLFEVALEAFEVLVEHVLPTEFIPAAKMVDLHPGEDPGLFKDPVDLFLVTPHDVPVIVVGLLPLAAIETTKDTVSEIGLELDA